jgi:hypothetical protein
MIKRKLIILVPLVTFAALSGQETKRSEVVPSIHIEDVLPDEIVPGICTSSTSGPLMVLSNRRTALTDKEIGAYILARLHSGYSVTLYPLKGDYIYAQEMCHPRKR